MNQEHQEAIRKVYLDAIVSSAALVTVLARRIEQARLWRDLTTAERAETSNLSLEEAGLADHWPTLKTLQEMEDKLDNFRYTLQACFEAD